MYIRRSHALIIFFVSVFMLQCGSSTRMTGSWKSPEATSLPYDQLVVMAMTSNVVARRMAELSMADELKKQDIHAIPSLEIFAPTFLNSQPSKEEILGKLKEENINVVMTIALVDKQTEQQYAPGSSSVYTPVTGYTRFGRYYSNYYPTYYDPGYYTMSKVYYVQTNLYDVASEELVWSAQSRTYDPENLESVSRSFAHDVVKRMQADGVME